MRYLLLILSIVLLSSCSTTWLAKKCACRFPVKDSVHDSISYKDGVVIQLPGETVYTNCDSIIALAAKQVASGSTHVISTKQVPCPPCPPSTVQHDTLLQFRDHYQVDSSKLFLMRKDLVSAQSSQAGWKKGALIEAGILAILIIIVLLMAYIKK